ncbi:MAG: iron-sulfur cluster assembly accessory protein [Myxococcota bacterium]|nr:iron-sulfur cluster assembly accessory protein [Myxococcota bacterium]
MDTATSTQQSTTATPAPTELPLRLTEAAVLQVREVMKSQSFEGYFFSVRVVPAGCSGFGYDLNLVQESKAGDVIWEQDGIKIATDAMSAKYLGGTEVDFVSGLQGQGFKFQNPQAKSTCGCGSSFST